MVFGERTTEVLEAGLESWLLEDFIQRFRRPRLLTVYRNLAGNGDTSAEPKGFGRILPDKDAAFPSFPRAEERFATYTGKGA